MAENAIWAVFNDELAEFILSGVDATALTLAEQIVPLVVAEETRLLVSEDVILVNNLDEEK